MTGALETARLRLEPWAETHTMLLVGLSAMPQVMRYIASGDVWPRAKAEEVAAAKRDHWARHGFGWRAAVSKATGDTVGFVALNYAGEGTVGLRADEYEIGWWLAPDVWGEGLAREGGARVRDDALETLRAPSVVARVQPANKPSIAVAGSLGLTPDFETTDDSGRPLNVYRLTARDWAR